MGKKGSGNWFSAVKKVFTKPSSKDLPADTKARRAFRALRGLLRLQALVRGHNVRKQMQMTMRCMQALVRVQSRVCARRIKLVQETLQSKLEEAKLRSNKEDQYKNKSLFKKLEADGWDNGNQSIEKILNITRRKQHAEAKRERALAYAYQQQQKWFHFDPHGEEDDGEFYGNEHENHQRGWNWLEKWMTSQSSHVVPRESSYVTLSSIDDMSEKIKMDLVNPLCSEDVNLFHHIVTSAERSPYSSWKHRQSNKDCMPSYMAPAQSAKAKVRSPGPTKPRSPSGTQWNTTVKRESIHKWSYDSSARSPNPKTSAK